MDEKVYELSKIMEKMTPELLTIGPIPISTTVFYQWLAMLVLFTLVFVATRNIQKKPKGAQTVVELLIGFIYSLSDPALGKEGRKFLPLLGSLFMFILTMNLLWFIPNAMPPTTDLSTTLGLALGTIVTLNIIGIKTNGLGGHLKHFAQPPALTPLNVIEELVKPVSLSLRLFGNMFGEKVAVTILFILIPILIPTPVMMLGVLMGCIQAFVFTLLTVTYLSQAVHGH
ncbi:F-type H+-transporting ATPase subunit a [Desulfitispora alkaliphila]|uniref:F0F1 ATP synthase subunit A n=1 Tax=Desulfitispora alkaliphila TaxID=622674 RepID=UPI003D1B2D36